MLGIVEEIAPEWKVAVFMSRPYYGVEESAHNYWYQRVPDLNQPARGFSYLRNALSSGSYPIVGVNVGKSSGRLGVQPFAYHWVVVSGLSNEWGRGPMRQWVRMYNPFNHQEESYHADQFDRSWKYLTFSNRELIVLSRQDRR